MTKHIFIGLGGSGVRTMSEVKYRIYKRTIAEAGMTPYETMNKNYRFIFVDTDDKDVKAANNKYGNKFENGTREFIDFTELINLGNENSRQIFQKATQETERHRLIRESVDQEVVNTIGDFKLSSGASAVRMVSRLAFINKSSDFYQLLVDDIAALRNNEVNPEFKYWVVSSCCGGTGSGILNDVLYYVNMANKMTFGDGDPAVGLYLFTPNYFCEQVSEDILHRMRCNAVAVFKELGLLNQWASDDEKNKNIHQYVDSLNGKIDRHKGYRPFDYLIPIDFNNDKGGNLGTQAAMYSTAAEMIYYTHDGNGAEGLESVVNNYRLSPFRNSADRYIISIGYSTIRKPIEEFSDYMYFRSQYEILQYGIIGSQYSSDLYRQHVHSVFKNQILSAFADFDNEMKRAIDNEVNINMAKEDDSDDIRHRLPQWMHNGLAQNAINKLTQIANINPSDGDTENGQKQKSAIINVIKNNLIDWIEGATRTNGLNYVYGVLLELDAYCTLLYKTMALGEQAVSVTGIAKTRVSSSSLLEKIDRLKKAAEKISPIERIKKDGNDIIKYLEGLIEWANAKRSELYDNMLIEVLKDLAYGDDGLIDKLRNNVLAIKSVAEKTCLEKMNYYNKLTSTFSDKILDKKSHYLPNITQFVKDGRWLPASEGNLFAQWYECIISQINTADGRIPDRNNDSSHSIEAFFNIMVAKNKVNMESDGYYLGNKTRLFTRDDKPYGRVIEDILTYVDATMQSLIDENQRIEKEWKTKEIIDLINELTTQEQLALRNANIPTYFFPNDTANTPAGLTQIGFTSTADNNTAMRVFPIANANECLPADNENVMYRMVAQIGMPYTSYINYSTYENTYNEATDKEMVHFHRLFANINNVQLPENEARELPIFVKYLLLAKMAPFYEDIISMGSGDFDRENCAKSPIVIKGDIVQLATQKALTIIGGELIELRLRRGTQLLFDEVVISDQGHHYCELYNAFTNNYATSKYELFSRNMINNIDQIKQGIINMHYRTIHKDLCTELTAQWNLASGKERELLGTILRSLTTTYNTPDHFLN